MADIAWQECDAVDDQEVTELLQGAVDLHVHPSPSPFEREIGILEAASQARDAGFRAIVVKSHHHSMVTDVLAVSEAVGGLPLPVYSGVALNEQIGGINPYAVELALNLGGRIVWFPTISSGRHICAHSKGLNFPHTSKSYRPNKAISILGDDGRLCLAALDVLQLVKDSGAILSGGHLGVDELDPLIRTALGMGLERVLVSHPNYVIGAEPSLCREWAEMGVFFEHELCMYDDRSSFYHWDLDVLLDYVRVVGIDHSLIGSDLGQRGNPCPVQAYRRILRTLLRRGVGETDIRRMVAVNPSQLLQP